MSALTDKLDAMADANWLPARDILAALRLAIEQRDQAIRYAVSPRDHEFPMWAERYNTEILAKLEGKA